MLQSIFSIILWWRLLSCNLLPLILDQINLETALHIYLKSAVCSLFITSPLRHVLLISLAFPHLNKSNSFFFENNFIFSQKFLRLMKGQKNRKKKKPQKSSPPLPLSVSFFFSRLDGQGLISLNHHKNPESQVWFSSFY